MHTSFSLVDAFADVPFSGNPAGVCFPNPPVSTSWMQHVAAEVNQAETAFLQLREDGDWDLRWFTPTVEVDLCGHATLASAHVLWASGRVPEAKGIRFHTRSGVLTCNRSEDRIEMDFPAEPASATEEDVTAALGLGRPPLFIGRNRMDVLAVLQSEAEVRTIEPDDGRISAVQARGVIVTARSDRAEYDFVSRFFAPQSGILEDPVTGSAHCCLGPYWSGILGKDQLVGFQASRRGGTVAVRCANDRVVLGGKAVLVFEGRLVV